MARSAQAAFVLLVVIAVILAFTTARLARDSAFEGEVRQLAEESVVEITGSELEKIQIEHAEDGSIRIELIVYTSEQVTPESVAELQSHLAGQLDQDVQLILTIIETEQIEIPSPGP